MTSVKDIMNVVEPMIKAVGSEPINLLDGLGRVLATDIHARSLIPPFDISNINGYAVNTKDVEAIGSVLKKVAESRPTKIYDAPLKKGECVLLFNGCPVPEGANAVVYPADVELYKSSVIFKKYITEGENISEAGLDINDSDVILKKGTILNSRHIALAKITDVPWLPVIRKPKIGIISNLEYDQCNPQFSYIQQKNSDAIKSFLSSFINARGGTATNLGTALKSQAPANQIPAFKRELQNAIESVDLLAVIGGIHKAGENLLWTSLLQRGADLEIFKIAIGRGEEIAIGYYENTPIIGLPDQNVASLICALLFLRPCIDKLLGIDVDNKEKFYATLDRTLDEFDRSTDYLYAKLYENDKGDKFVTPVSAQDALMISVLTDTNCIIVVDKNMKLQDGSEVEIIMFTGSIIST